MSEVYNPEAEVSAQIEKLELEAKNVRRRIEHAHTEADKRMLNRQLQEIKDEITHFQARMP